MVIITFTTIVLSYLLYCAFELIYNNIRIYLLACFVHTRIRNTFDNEFHNPH